MAVNAPTLTRPEKQARTRERLLDAAAQVFARRGYHAATLEEIGREAGHSTGAVYSNFSGKEELFLALADREVADRLAEVEAVMEAATGGGEPGAATADQFRSFIARDPEWPLLFYEFWSYGVRNPRLREEFDRRRRAVRGAIAEALEAFTERQGLHLRFPADHLAAAISASINGLAFERVADPDTLPDEMIGYSIWTLLENAWLPSGSGSGGEQ